MSLFKAWSRGLALLFLALALSLAGCSGSGHASAKEPLVVWHWTSDREDAFRQLAKYYEQRTGQPVLFELYAPSDIYTRKIKAAAQSRTLPDLFGVLGEQTDFASFIKAGHVARLSPLGSDGKPTEPWAAELYVKGVEVNTFPPGNPYQVPPGLYGAPLDMTNIQFLYNKKLFRQAGLDPEKPPQTWEEFMRAWRLLKSHNIPGLVGGFGETWLGDVLANCYAFNIMDEQKIYDTYDGKVPYTDPDWLKVFGLFKEMADAGVFVNGAVTMVNKTAEQNFANNGAAFAWNGSWCVNVYRGMNPVLEYAPMLPPRVRLDRPMKIWGGAGTSLMVNDRSPRREAAKAFLVWMTERTQQEYLTLATRNLPSNKAAAANIPPILKAFSEVLDETIHENTLKVHENPRVRETLSKGLQSIMIKEKTPLQVAQEVEDMNRRVHGK